MITYFKDIFSPNEPYLAKIESVVARLKDENGKSKAICEKIRATEDKRERASLKKQLPVILFSGEFSSRSIAGFDKPSGLVVVDFDHLGDRKAAFFEKIKADKYTHLVFLSPGGDGYKVVVKIPANKATYRQSCRALNEYYKDEALDGFEDECRACFESYDPDACFIPGSATFELLSDGSSPIGSSLKTGVPHSFEETYLRLQKWLENTEGFAYRDGQKHVFLVRLASACNRTGLREEDVCNRLFQDYGAKADVPLADFKRIVGRVYRTYSAQYGTRFFDAEGQLMDAGTDTPKDDIFEVLVQDVIYLDGIRDRMLSTFKTGMNGGETTHFASIDPHFKWLRGELTVVGGIMNHGKSTLLMQMILAKAIKDGFKCAVFSPEQYPPDYFYNDLIQAYLGKPVDNFFVTQCSEAEYRRGMDFVKEHFFYINPPKPPTPKYIRERFLEAKEKHGVDFFVIDPFNQLDHDWGKHGRDDRYISEFLSEHHRFGQDEKVFNLVVVHPKGSLTKKQDGNYECPDVYDYAGGAMWGNKADNILAAYRPFYSTDKENTTIEFRSQKIKKQRLVGMPGTATLAFSRQPADGSWGRFLESREGKWISPL